MKYHDGQQVEVRTAHGDWVRAVARSDKFLNTDYVDRRTTPWLVVRVQLPSRRGNDVVNWPETDVRPYVPGPTR